MTIVANAVQGLAEKYIAQLTLDARAFGITDISSLDLIDMIKFLAEETETCETPEELLHRAASNDLDTMVRENLYLGLEAQIKIEEEAAEFV